MPVHTPDILAAAEAAEAFLEAYLSDRDPRWLKDAATWARRGLPFVYLWDDLERPFLLGASIPVFGATWMQGSWFGRPVQWNGLRYAEAIWKLADHDKSLPWREIATALVHSALHQQDVKGENVALWPDNISAVDSSKCPWVFSPRMVLSGVLELMGRGEGVSTAMVGQGERRLHLSANARIADTAWDGTTCSFRVTYPPGEQGVVVVFGVERPAGVSLDARPISERLDVEKGSEPGWRHARDIACLSIRVPKDGESSIRIEGAAFRPGPGLPRVVEKIDFKFDDSTEGWTAAHDVGDLGVADGSLAGRISGPDPYLARSMLRVRADECPVVVLRLRISAGHMGQLYWATESSPAIAEDKVIAFPIQADGRFHEVRLEPGKHSLWAGQTITALRIDPGNGASSGDFAIDSIRAEGH